jgi:branched-chain amino acid transport system permease protein
MKLRPTTILAIIACIILAAVQFSGLINGYYSLILCALGINIILCLSLNVVNGYMGEFSVGHAGFMAIGAYGASYLTTEIIPAGFEAWLFPFVLIAGGLAAALAGYFVAVLSFKTRGDYLAIITLAFLMITKAAFNVTAFFGAATGMMGMPKLASPLVVFIAVVITILVIRNLINSAAGRAIQAVREDEIAAVACGVDTRRAKVLAFVVSSFFAGVAGGLFAHVFLFINPQVFDLVRSTGILVMVYLGGVASIGGSILGATLFTLLYESLAPYENWRQVIVPALLVVLMLFRPNGIMGMKEWPWLAAQRRLSVKTLKPKASIPCCLPPADEDKP